jgi:hypothetical protein
VEKFSDRSCNRKIHLCYRQWNYIRSEGAPFLAVMGGKFGERRRGDVDVAHIASIPLRMLRG